MTEIVFSKNDVIGAAAAEEDSLYLKECFVDTGDVEVLLDSVNPKRIVVGRTGAGKSALLIELLNKEKNAVAISPHSLALNFIANNNVIAFFEEAGVNLGLFYSLLWRHILVVELLKKKFNINDESAQRNYMNNVRKLLYKKNKVKEQAVDYLENWGNKFWLTTEERVHELVEKIEKNLSGSVSGELKGTKLNLEAAKKLTSEQKTEIIENGKRVVSDIQIRELDNIINVLADEVFNDPQEKYYLLIDSLDEGWVDNRIKLKLIRSLIDTSRRLKKINHVKIILALRQDLLDKVIHFEREPGFQEEKYESLYLYVSWNKKFLLEVINTRINLLMKRKYTSESITVEDIFPKSVNSVDTLDYILNRTLMRPRDIIAFINECILVAEGKSQISANDIKNAEFEYSYKRLNSLVTEWHEVYPNLECVLKMFEGLNSSFDVSEITKDFLEEKYIESLNDDAKKLDSDPMTRQINTLFSAKGGNFNSIRNFILRQLYIIGFIGIKSSPGVKTNWSYLSRFSLTPGQIKNNSKVYIHPTYYRALNIDEKTRIR